jgi:hypothetical protein
MSDVRKIVEFVGEAMARDDAPGRLQRLVVCHIVKGNKLGDELRTVRVPEVPSEEWILEAATKIVSGAATEAMQLGAGVQRYAVQAYFEGEKEKPLGRIVFTCAAGGDADDLGSIGTEGPDGTGLVAMAMRHSEFHATLAFKGQERREKSLMDENDRLRRQLLELENERRKSWIAMEEVYGHQVERETARRSAATKDKMWSDLWERFSLLLPIGLNQIAGKTIFPQVATTQLLLKQFVEGVSKEDFDRWSRVLRPEQMAAFVELGQSVSQLAADPKTADQNGAGSAAELHSQLATIASGIH